MAKNTKNARANRKRVEQISASTDICRQVWVFDSVDTDGHFRFSPRREDMDCEDILEKIIHFSKRTWIEIKQDMHDDRKSKNHYLTYDALSDLAKERITRLHLTERTDEIFSMRLNNTIRIIGIREGDRFVVKWFDPKHEFSPSSG